MVFKIVLLVFLVILHVSVFPDAFPQLLLILFQLELQILVLEHQPLVLLLRVLLDLSHLHRTDLVARVDIILVVVVAPLLPLLGKLFHPLDVVLAPHVVVERVLARHHNQAKWASKPLDLRALLLVFFSLLVRLHLVPGPDPHVAVFAVHLLLIELVLPVVIPLAVELGGDIVQPFSVEEPLLLWSELPGALILVPEVFGKAGDQVIVQTFPCLVPHLVVLEPPELLQMLFAGKVTNHALTVIEGEVTLFTVQTP